MFIVLNFFFYLLASFFRTNLLELAWGQTSCSSIGVFSGGVEHSLADIVRRFREESKGPHFRGNLDPHGSKANECHHGNEISFRDLGALSLIAVVFKRMDAPRHLMAFFPSQIFIPADRCRFQIALFLFTSISIALSFTERELFPILIYLQRAHSLGDEDH